MKDLYNLGEMLCEELSDYGRKNEISGGDLEVIDKLAHATKNVYKIMESKEEIMEDGYSNRGSYARGRGSNRGGSYAGGSYEGGSYEGGGGMSNRGSYARGRGRNARRDSMGRYSSERGYSRDAEEMVEQLRDMEQTAPDDQTRRSIQRLISELER